MSACPKQPHTHHDPFPLRHPMPFLSPLTHTRLSTTGATPTTHTNSGNDLAPCTHRVPDLPHRALLPDTATTFPRPSHTPPRPRACTHPRRAPLPLNTQHHDPTIRHRPHTTPTSSITTTATSTRHFPHDHHTDPRGHRFFNNLLLSSMTGQLQ